MREAVAYSQLGMIEEGLETIKEVLKDRVYAPNYLRKILGLEALRNDDRFEKILNSRKR